MTHTSSRKTRFLGAALAAAVAFGGALFAPTSAHAATQVATDATLDWGIRDEFRRYIHVGVAAGNSEVIGTVTKDDEIEKPGKAYHWTAGIAEEDGTKYSLQYQGGVRFYGHDHGNGPILDLTVTNPRIAFDTATNQGEIFLNVRSKQMGSGVFTDTPNVRFGTFNLVDNSGGGNARAFSGTGAKLTAEGSAALSNFLPAGSDLTGTFNFGFTVTPPPAAPVATTTKVTVAPDSVEKGNDVTFSAAVTPNTAAGEVEFTNASGAVLATGTVVNGTATAVYSTAGAHLVVGANEITGTFKPATPADYATSNGTANLTVTPAAPGPIPMPGVPTFEVFQADGVTPIGNTPVYEGDTLVIKGQNFTPSANQGTRPPLAGKDAGNYVIFGKFDANWKPSANAPAPNRVASDTKWAITDASFAGANLGPLAAQRIVLAPNGDFEYTLVVPELHANSPANGIVGVYTYPGSGAINPAHELNVDINFAGKRPAPGPGVPAITTAINGVAAGADVEVTEGTEVTFSASGYAAGTDVEIVVHSNPIPLGTHQANAAGVVSVTWTVPAGFAAKKDHEVRFTANGATVKQAFTAKAAAAAPGGGAPGATPVPVNPAPAAPAKPTTSATTTAKKPATLAKGGAAEQSTLMGISAMLVAAAVAVSFARRPKRDA